MKAKVSAARFHYSDDDEINKFKKIGFKFDKQGFLKAPDEVTIEINSLIELTEFIREYGSVVVDYRDVNSLYILIYNDYIE